jgi:hypothetical protein
MAAIMIRKNTVVTAEAKTAVAAVYKAQSQVTLSEFLELSYLIRKIQKVLQGFFMCT